MQRPPQRAPGATGPGATYGCLLGSRHFMVWTDGLLVSMVVALGNRFIWQWYPHLPVTSRSGSPSAPTGRPGTAVVPRTSSDGNRAPRPECRRGDESHVGGCGVRQTFAPSRHLPDSLHPNIRSSHIAPVSPALPISGPPQPPTAPTSERPPQHLPPAPSGP